MSTASVRCQPYFMLVTTAIQVAKPGRTTARPRIYNGMSAVRFKEGRRFPKVTWPAQRCRNRPSSPRLPRGLGGQERTGRQSPPCKKAGGKQGPDAQHRTSKQECWVLAVHLNAFKVLLRRLCKKQLNQTQYTHLKI